MDKNSYTYNDILIRLGIKDSQVAKDLVLQIVELALQKIGLAVNNLIPDNKQTELQQMLNSGSSAEEVLEYAESTIPKYQQLLKATIDDSVDEMAANQNKVDANTSDKN